MHHVIHQVIGRLTLKGAKAQAEEPINIWRVSRSIVVAPSDEEALDYVLNPDGPMSYWYRYFYRLSKLEVNKICGARKSSTSDNITWQKLRRSNAHGSPETVLDKLVALRDLTGHFGVLTAMAHEWDNKAFVNAP